MVGLMISDTSIQGAYRDCVVSLGHFAALTKNSSVYLAIARFAISLGGEHKLRTITSFDLSVLEYLMIF